MAKKPGYWIFPNMNVKYSEIVRPEGSRVFSYLSFWFPDIITLKANQETNSLS